MTSFKMADENLAKSSATSIVKKVAYRQDKGHQIDGLVQDCSNSIVNALGLLQSCTKPSKWHCDRCFRFDNPESGCRWGAKPHMKDHDAA